MSKLALLIGINYTGKQYALGGCINDSHGLKKCLQSHFSYEDKQITLMTDDEKGDFYPSGKNMVRQLNKAVDKINRDNILEFWFSFSGHGSYIRDRNGDEVDGRDEILIPIDYPNGIISDDKIISILSKIKNPKCRVFCMLDCCHSGTLVDLQHNYKRQYTPGKRQWVKKKKRIRIGRNRYKVISYRTIERTPESWYWKTENHESSSTSKKIKCKVLSLSGCQDPQTSNDVYDRNKQKWGGALTNAFLEIIKDKKDSNISCYNLCSELNKELKKQKHTQSPQIASNYPIDNDTFFYMNGNCHCFISSNSL